MLKSASTIIIFFTLVILTACSGGGSSGDGGGLEGAASVVVVSESDAIGGNPYVDIYDSTKTCNGTTLFSDIHDTNNLRILEVNMSGAITWEYHIPASIVAGAPVGLDSEYLTNGNILFTLSGSGVYEVDRSGNIVWSKADPQVSHDADRLDNGNTIYSFGNGDTKDNAQVKEVNAAGDLVWAWYAKDSYDYNLYKDRTRQGWTHTNGVTRLSNGNTLVSLRNFDTTTEVDSTGSIVWSYDWSSLGASGVDPHEPELQANGNLLVCLQNGSPYVAAEIERSTGALVWSYSRGDLRTTRDCDRLPGGNTLILSVLTNGTGDTKEDDDSVIFEVTPSGETVWRLRLKDAPVGESPGHFFKAERACG